MLDAGLLDAVMLDASLLDAGLLDAGLLDAGLLDAVMLDAVMLDAGLLDVLRESESCSCNSAPVYCLAATVLLIDDRFAHPNVIRLACIDYTATHYRLHCHSV